MAEAARVVDTLHLPAAVTKVDAAGMQARFEDVSAPAMLAELLTGELTGRVAAVSSFGAESAVLLHMVAQVDRDVPVVFTDTQKMFGETLAYRDELAERLGLTDLRVYRPDPRVLRLQDDKGLRWSYDPDGCCDLRNRSRYAMHSRRSARGSAVKRAFRRVPAARCPGSMRWRAG